jgi:predicted acyltransferase
VKLFFFGLLVNDLLNLNFPAQRWPGVLQRIAIGYGAASLAVLFLSRRAQAILAAALLVGYWIVLLVVPVPEIAPTCSLRKAISRATSIGCSSPGGSAAIPSATTRGC